MSRRRENTPAQNANPAPCSCGHRDRARGQRFGLERLSQCPDEIAAAEFLKIKIIGCRSGPEPKSINSLAAVTHHRAIERNTDQSGWLAEHGAQTSATAASNEQLSGTSTVSF